MKKLIIRTTTMLLLFFAGLLGFSSPRLAAFVETQIINTHQPVITSEREMIAKASVENNWQGVKLLSFQRLLGEVVHPTSQYVGALLIPSLNINVPLADYTSDSTYTFGAGMLEPHYIDSNSPLVIGAHNLGWKRSTALFTPLAFHRLSGRQVIITNFKIVRQYQIVSREIISPRNISAPFQGKADSLALLTCTTDNQKRILVKARLTRRYPFKELSGQIKKELRHKYKINNVEKPKKHFWNPEVLVK